MSEEQGNSHRHRGYAIQNQPTQTIGWNTEYEKPPPYNPYFNNDQVITAQPSVEVISANASAETEIPLDYCLPGLEYLSVLDQLIICQQIEILEILTGYETENKYQIKNIMGQPVFYAVEDSGYCARYCCGTLRPLNMVILDNFEREVLNFERPLNCQSCCFPCCLQEMEVKSPLTGEVIGLIEQNWNLICPSFNIKSAHGDKILKIRGPLLTSSCCCQDIVFNILTPEKEEIIGSVTKQWSGFCKEAFTDADNFSITFPVDLDVKIKATLLAAVFLIDYMYYEDSDSLDVNTSCLASE